MSKNIVLIGMPGAGKSTVGVILAKQTSMDFIDTDLLIQSSEGQSLQSIVDNQGHIQLRKIEEEILVDLNVQNSVVSTGGSAVYSDKAMQHLKKTSILVFLDVDLDTLQERVGDFSERGIAKAVNQSFADLFEERFALYSRYTDITINCAGLSQEETCAAIVEKIETAS